MIFILKLASGKARKRKKEPMINNELREEQDG